MNDDKRSNLIGESLEKKAILYTSTRLTEANLEYSSESCEDSDFLVMMISSELGSHVLSSFTYSNKHCF